MGPRHWLAILSLPFMVVVVVPAWILQAGADSRWPADAPAVWLARLAGLLLASAGFGLFAWCVRLFARVGQGTLAPWDPTRRLVAVGPYQYMRNPMISGVAGLLIGMALGWGSWRLAVWAGLFLLINHVYFVWSEEPGLEKRFGEPYRQYKAHVPRWLPRRRPWTGA